MDMYYKKAEEPKIMRVFVFLLFAGTILFLTFHIGLMVGAELERQSGECKHSFDVFQMVHQIAEQYQKNDR